MNEADGTVVVVGDTAVIAFERELRHPVEVVWAALTDESQRAAWLGPGTVEPRVGGQVAIHAGPPPKPGMRASMTGQVLAWEPPRVLEHEWRQPGLAVSVVRYELEARGERTVLRLTHRRSVSQGAVGGRAGWHAYLDRLALLLAGEAVPSWVSRRGDVEGLYGEAPLPAMIREDQQ